ncbi:(deoxy)nucleoside triphosphate pyrophosphohydrolase [Bailinhaonella thermotolerans]|uniref:8-oxo-dGTP diphosphatase n=1 Tax=Bailinhaonella thermotolerans TaxID=1070861 RepID=A0A3A4AWY1_9ACTN|nr:(deoxy)nucleoside triphosphate pyrophosphohydrolase [Bailinhaonella thermotolerans]RJL33383.1 (deoxy)nucleoside triphosphate pyrophosphohydrolase [Bailinhaonella thermotolerans]
MDNLVVGAAIVAGGRLLAAQRAEPPELAGGWEFPGGKVDPGESDEQALIRECREELGVEIALGARVGGDWRLGGDYVMRVWLATLVAGTPEAREHLALRWLRPDELYDVEWLPGDLPIVEAVEPRLRKAES